MNTTDFAAAVAPALTLANAREYAAQTDKYLWVEYHILDALDIRATDARVNWVEDQFDAMLASVTVAKRAKSTKRLVTLETLLGQYLSR